MNRLFIIFSIILAPIIARAAESSPLYIALADSADMFIKNERWDAAEQTIIKALRLEPANFSNSLLFSNLGIVRTNRGEYQSALEAFELGLAIAPGSAVIRNNRAMTYIMMRDYDNALLDLDKSLDIDSIQDWPLQMRGMLRVRKNDLDGAQADFSRLIKLNPFSHTAMEGLGNIEEAKGNFDDAIKYYDEAIKLYDNPETRSARILAKINSDRFSEAAEDIHQSISKYPEYADFYIWRGYLHRLNYRNDEAEADKKNAIIKGADPQYVQQFIP